MRYADRFIPHSLNQVRFDYDDASLENADPHLFERLMGVSKEAFKESPVVRYRASLKQIPNDQFQEPSTSIDSKKVTSCLYYVDLNKLAHPQKPNVLNTSK